MPSDGSVSPNSLAQVPPALQEYEFCARITFYSFCQIFFYFQYIWLSAPYPLPIRAPFHTGALANNIYILHAPNMATNHHGAPKSL